MVALDKMPQRSSDLNFLIVENDPNLRRLWRSCVEMRGIVVQEADSTRSALQMARVQPFDVAVLDLYLGADDVFRLAAELTAVNAECEFVVLAGSDRFDRARIAQAMPAVGVILHKPVDVEDMNAVCDAALQQDALEGRTKRAL